MSARLFIPLLLCVAACAEAPPALPPARGIDPVASSRFDSKSTGTVTGVVRWDGPIPTAEPFRSIDEPLTDKPPSPARDWPNPNAPRIDPRSRALAGAVVLLQGVDPRRARPWHHRAARVELLEQTYRIQQDGESNVGFVRPGEPIDFVSLDDRLHVAQGRGDAFFSITLPRPHRPRARSFDAPGIVELTSGSGYFWMRAYLFVSDHPYLIRTGADGRFRLKSVPAGDYNLVAWHPDWRVAGERRNPDLFRVQQVHFRAPLRSSCQVRIRVDQGSDAVLTLR